MSQRFFQRVARQAEVLNGYFGEPQQSKTRTYSRHETGQDRPLPSPPPQYSQFSDSTVLSEGSAIPKGSLILVTGANGYQGAHVVDQLLKCGYRVRGTVADLSNTASMSVYLNTKYGAGSFEIVRVREMSQPGAFDSAVRLCAGVVHVASVTTMSSDPFEVIPPSMAGAMNALQAAAKEKSVQRFVFCSCACAAVPSNRCLRNEITSDSWNTVDFADAWAPLPDNPDRALAVYASSKMQAETMVWRWYRDAKPAFVLNTVLPDTLWGRVLIPTRRCCPSTVGILKGMYEGKLVSHPARHFVDVQDSALIHVAALVLPDIAGQRIFAVSAPWSISAVAEILRGLYPNRQIQDGPYDTGKDMTLFRESVQAEELLRRMGKKGWTDLETSVARSLEPWSKDSRIWKQRGPSNGLRTQMSRTSAN